MKIDLSQFRQVFLQESAEHVSSMETGLLELRARPGDLELLHSIFRSAHSIKGGAGSFGLTALVRLTHSLENVLENLRSGEQEATAELIRLLLHSVDFLQLMLAAATGEGGDVPLPDGAGELIAQLDALACAPHEHGDTPEPASRTEETVSLAIERSPEQKRFLIEFRPRREMFESGTNPILLLRNLASLGVVTSCQVHTGELPPLSEIDPAQCYLSWTVSLLTTSSEDEVREIFAFVEHLAEVTIEEQPPREAFGAANKDALVIHAAHPINSPNRPDVEAGKPQTAVVRKQGLTGEASSIRVPTEKVDRLIDLVGELLIAQLMTAQMVESFSEAKLPKLREAVATMARNTRELHERVMSVRMLPVGSLFQRYTRTVYDIAQATSKDIRLELSGEDTEIDKSMLELLGDPLTHLIRNAADHGIESPEVRVAAGKPATGTVGLRAFHRAGRIVIEVSDDGAGIDPERVYKKAVERGLIVPGAQLTAGQIQMLIFEPGFSTREEVSDLSGRGVGMDVVKRNIQQLSGSVGLHSVLGSGCTVTLELPLTLAILEGLLIRVADRTLVLPLLSVLETVAPQPGQITRIGQGEVIVIREESIPLMRLHRFLALAPTAGSHEPEGDRNRSLIVVVETGRKKIGLVVEELLGQQQVVVKSLERNLHRVDGLMGATILGDGSVAPILDIAGLSELNLFTAERKAAVA